MRFQYGEMTWEDAPEAFMAQVWVFYRIRVEPFVSNAQLYNEVTQFWPEAEELNPRQFNAMLPLQAKRLGATEGKAPPFSGRLITVLNELRRRGLQHLIPLEMYLFDPEGMAELGYTREDVQPLLTHESREIRQAAIQALGILPAESRGRPR